MLKKIKFVEKNWYICYSLYRVLYYKDVDMMDKLKNKNVILSIIVIVVGLFIAGGTYAYLTISFNVSNSSYSGKIECFKINYNIDNGDGTKNIEGTLFPSASPNKGLSGKVSMKVDQSCNVTGTGTLKFHLDSATSSTLTKAVVAHCENANTGETLDDYETNSSCSSAGGTWVTTGTGLKYAVYNNSSATGNALSNGYIASSSIGSDIVIYDGFNVASTQLDYYVFVWLDGYVTDDSYVSQPVSGYIHASVLQNE